MTGQDGLRDEIAAALADHEPVYLDGYLTGEPAHFDCTCGWTGDPEIEPDSGYRTHQADVVRPVVQARIDAAREQVAEQIAQELAAVPDEVYPEDVFGGPLSAEASELINELLRDEGLGSLDRISAQNMRHAYSMAARIARQHAKGDGDV